MLEQTSFVVTEITAAPTRRDADDVGFLYTLLI